jgi:hypothetical protein
VGPIHKQQVSSAHSQITFIENPVKNNTYRAAYDRISTVVGCPRVMTIWSHELAVTGPSAEVLCPSLLVVFVVRKSY